MNNAQLLTKDKPTLISVAPIKYGNLGEGRSLERQSTVHVPKEPVFHRLRYSTEKGKTNIECWS
jgi:hypothetical protein